MECDPAFRECWSAIFLIVKDPRAMEVCVGPTCNATQGLLIYILIPTIPHRPAGHELFDFIAELTTRWT